MTDILAELLELILVDNWQELYTKEELEKLESLKFQILQAFEKVEKI